jgi:hypothetical protein
LEGVGPRHRAEPAEPDVDHARDDEQRRADLEADRSLGRGLKDDPAADQLCRDVGKGEGDQREAHELA